MVFYCNPPVGDDPENRCEDDIMYEQAKNEFDIENEIKEMLEWYSEHDYDEADAYREMIDRGYTPDLLDIYYGMEQFI